MYVLPVDDGCYLCRAIFVVEGVVGVEIVVLEYGGGVNVVLGDDVGEDAEVVV
jgi:hypothetical protein